MRIFCVRFILVIPSSEDARFLRLSAYYVFEQQPPPSITRCALGAAFGQNYGHC
jgi:hypothetical protein